MGRSKGGHPSTKPAHPYKNPLAAPAGQPPRSRSRAVADRRPLQLPGDTPPAGDGKPQRATSRHKKKASEHLRQVVGLIRRGPDESQVVRKTTSLRLDAISSEALTLHALQRRVTKNTLISDLINGWLYIATDYAQALFAETLPRGARAAIVPERWPGYLASLGFVSARQDPATHASPELEAARGGEAPLPPHDVPPPAKRAPGGEYLGTGPAPEEIPHAPPPPKPQRIEGLAEPGTRAQTGAQRESAPQEEPVAEAPRLRVGFGNAAQRLTEGRQAPAGDAIDEVLAEAQAARQEHARPRQDPALESEGKKVE